MKIDINQTLRSMREHIENAREAQDNETHMREMALAIENMETIDRWLINGAVLPDNWCPTAFMREANKGRRQIVG